ncbi:MULTISPECIES: sensor histidine kinase [Streptosporangium]|uniref:histidine kinase n=1 Tax=Streptosporangium brasiliense TaxID=47480 RepID=A0ABT9R5T4_9ACTN|nr:sensor histidine kinase [Streptosporangium brasiliense]MDP9863795.1 signal transduction histidine kinase [Streptosporangium brasiliense]
MKSRKFDALITVAVLTLGVAGTYGRLSSSGMPERPLDALGLSLLVLPALSLAFRRTAPVWTGVVAVGCGIAYYGMRYPGIFAAAPALIAIYTAATLGRRRLAVVLAAALAVGVGVLVALADTDPEPGGLSLLSGWLVAVVVVGEMVRNRRAYLHEVEQRAVEAERTRDEAALRRAGEERLWIAQELHDTLTHAISVINIQAAAATHLLDRRPEQAREALAAIRDSGHEAMRELRATLGVLRQVDAEDPGTGLARLPRLVARAEAVGLPVKVTVVGEAGMLAPDVDRAAYRIAQEAFTNVLRHAGPASITLTTEYRPGTIVLRVADDGRSDATAAGQGMGIIGMRERALAVGGSLTAGPRPEGGFEVRAELPLVSS